ncbi:hypothetical protein LCGC14_0531300 [marine sediment metagenome]|uniref:Uncharacterized protein n=1 Tax=marine sediment metagenome TaxID=412755 RepID=A0A0F9S085_9ZZZZ
MSLFVCEKCHRRVETRKDGLCIPCYRELNFPEDKIDSDIGDYPEEITLRNKRVAYLDKKKNILHLRIPHDRVDDFHTSIRYDIVFRIRRSTLDIAIE